MRDPVHIGNVPIRLVASRPVPSGVPSSHARKPDPSRPFMLGSDRLINPGVKICMIFHLSKRKWSNRGNQSAADGTGRKERSALFQPGVAVSVFVTGLAVCAGVLPAP